MQQSSKNDDSSLCYDVIITIKNFKIDKFGDFSSEIDFNTKMDHSLLHTGRFTTLDQG